MGVRMSMTMIADFLSGALVPLPLFPEALTKYIYFLPFASMQNAPFRIYIGNISSKESILSMCLQLFWAGILILLGKFIMCKAMKKVIVQGG